MAGNCDATNGAGLSNAPTPGWDSSADCSSVMNICSPPTGLSSISPASGSRCGNVYETRSKHSGVRNSPKPSVSSRNEDPFIGGGVPWEQAGL